MIEEKVWEILHLLRFVKLAISLTLFVCWNLVTRLWSTDVSFLFPNKIKQGKLV
jgi:hypothetical protein